ncbi:FliH/SctL family protein [Desulfovibrio sp. JC010]|uniref:FliH/SctL family protein n=1 Tax=Desulfovibrio sp. JC010 TaxID=2593641 RepID=UPI0013D67BC6|nr:FliH/SctL family protein [Desulfovibrio sp. JC010]NDV28249.1 flagellar assembly protein FliH [Desulfovibrio sp. JC010]
MSLSNAEEDKFYTGRVIMGLDSNNKTQEMTIQEMEGKKKPTWNEDTDREYYERVKVKAQNMAKEIIAKAMAEAETIKANAQAEGYAAGQQQAAQEAEQHMIGFSQNVGQTLQAIQDQSHNIMMAQSADAISLVFMVIEKTLAVEMESRRQEILGALLDEALNRIDSLTQLVIKVSPADSDIIGPLLEHAKTEHPDLAKWRIKADPAIDNGGIIVEAADAMIENTVTSRWEGVQEILGQLAPGTGE